MTTKKSTNHEIEVELDLAMIIMEKSGEYIPPGKEVRICIESNNQYGHNTNIYVKLNEPHVTKVTWTTKNE